MTKSFPLPKVLVGTWIISAVLLMVVGSSLVFMPTLARQYWPWSLTAFNQRFLGAFYLGAAIPLVGYLVRPRPSVLRLLLPLFTFFTTYVYFMSLGYRESFPVRMSSQIWFWLYGAVSGIGWVYCWKFRRYFQLSGGAKTWVTWAYRGQAMLLIAYGLGLLIMPSVFAETFWLWPLDSFHAHLYAGIFLSGALIQLYMGQQCQDMTEELKTKEVAPSTPSCGLIFGMTQLLTGIGIAAGIWRLDLQMSRLDWQSPIPWLWQVFFLMFAGLGGYSVLHDLLKQQGHR